MPVLHLDRTAVFFPSVPVSVSREVVLTWLFCFKKLISSLFPFQQYWSNRFLKHLQKCKGVRVRACALLATHLPALCMTDVGKRNRISSQLSVWCGGNVYCQWAFSCPIKIITNVQLSVKNQRASPEKSGFFAARMSEVLKPHPRTEAISQVSTFLSRMS